MFFPVLSGLLWLLLSKFLGRKAGWIFTPLSCALPQMAMHPGPSEIRTERKEMQLVGVDSTLLEPQLEWMKRKFSLLKNFGSCGLSLLTTTSPTTTAWLLEGQAGENGEKKENQRGKGFSHSLLDIRSSVSHFQNEGEQSCPRALSVTWCPLPSVQAVQSRLQVLGKAGGMKGRERWSSHH